MTTANTITIWHNPRCSKSRATLKLLEDAGHRPDVRLYLQDPPTRAELMEALAALNIGAADLARKGEAVWKELALNDASDDDVISAMLSHPILIERPLVLANGRGALGRPPEAVLDIL